MSRTEYRITLMGTGTSIGIPVPGCRCRVCLSRNKKNHRSRCSALIQAMQKNILIDTAPEFRLQALAAGIDRLDAVFWTHGHADHLHGLDDLRALTWNKAIPGYASEDTVKEIETRFEYLWKTTQRGGGKARVNLNCVKPDESVAIGSLRMIPIPVVHGKLPVYGWRCGPIAYITDASTIPPSSYQLLENLGILIIGALHLKNHPTHFSISQALDEIEKIRPAKAYLSHISHEASWRDITRVLPRGVNVAWDGLTCKTT